MVGSLTNIFSVAKQHKRGYEILEVPYCILFLQFKMIMLLVNNQGNSVLRAHKEAVNSLSGSGSAKLGTVATVVAAANSTAVEASKEIEAAMKISMRAALGLITNRPNEGQLDDLTIMKVHFLVKALFP